jgi:hypothetical protein
MHKGLSLTAIGIITLAGAAISASPASAATLRCGDTITRNVTLTRDLACVGDGLHLGANGLTVNLNGHRLTGSGTGTGIAAGLTQSEQLNVATIRNGTISGFQEGFRRYYFGGQVLISSVIFSRNSIAVNSVGSAGGGNSKGLLIRNSVLAANTVGISQIREFPSFVSFSTFSGNGTAVFLYDAEATLSGNSFVRNKTGVSSPGNTGVRLRNNIFRDGGLGIRLENSGYSVIVEHNSFARLALGAEIKSNQASVLRNTFTYNGSAGLLMHGSGYGGGGSIQGNIFERNGFRPGLQQDDSGNALTAGLWADAGKVLTDNVARRNAGYGIEGYDVIDGGGNRASSNGNPAQCLGTTCTH